MCNDTNIVYEIRKCNVWPPCWWSGKRIMWIVNEWRAKKVQRMWLDLKKTPNLHFLRTRRKAVLCSSLSYFGEPGCRLLIGANISQNNIRAAGVTDLAPDFNMRHDFHGMGRSKIMFSSALLVKTAFLTLSLSLSLSLTHTSTFCRRKFWRFAVETVNALVEHLPVSLEYHVVCVCVFVFVWVYVCVCVLRVYICAYIHMIHIYMNTHTHIHVC